MAQMKRLLRSEEPDRTALKREPREFEELMLGRWIREVVNRDGC